MQQVFKCPKCGKQCDPSSQFCGGCGTRLFVGDQRQDYNNQQIYSCPGCGQTVTYGVRFCENCGTQLSWPAQQQPQRLSHYQQQPSTPPYYQQQPNYNQESPRPQKRGGSPWTIIGVLVALLAVAGGIFAVLRMNLGSSSLPNLPFLGQGSSDTIELPWGSTIKVVFNGPPELEVEWEKLGMADALGSQLHVIGNVKNVSSQPIKFSDVNYYLDGYQVAFTNYGPGGKTLTPGETTKIMQGITGFTEYTKVLEVRIVGFQKIGGIAPASGTIAQSQTVFTKAPENPQTPAEVLAAIFFLLDHNQWSKAVEYMAPNCEGAGFTFRTSVGITRVEINDIDITGYTALIHLVTISLEDGTELPVAENIPFVQIDGKWKLSCD